MKNPRTSKGERFTIADLVRSIWYFIAEDRRKYVFFSFILMLALAYEFLPPYLVGKIISFLSNWKQGDALMPLGMIIAFLVVSSALVAVARLASKRRLGDISINARYRAKVWGFERLLGFSLAWHQKESTGNKAQRILTGSEAMREWTRDIINSVFPTFISFTGTLITCLLLSPWFALFFLYYIGVFLIIESWFDRKIIILSDRINASMENASGTFVESTSNILSVKALGAGKSVAEKVVSREETARILSQERNHIGISKWTYFQLHNSLAWGFFLGGLALAVLYGKLPVEFFLTYSIYFGTMRGNVTQFIEQIQVMIERRSNLCRMMPIFRETEHTGKGTLAFPAQWDEIRFDSVNFKYADKRVLQGFTLNIKRGETLGIAGHSGSGKSTLVKLLLGLYECESGSVSLGGVEVKDIRFEELTSRISVVLQETELFNLTVRDNITMMRDVDKDILDKACRIACVDELIDRLPNGFDTVIGEKGYTLSGGERQRIGIARAVCRNAEILLLDEATSALDNATEERVMEGLTREFGDDKTVLMIAHRTTTLKDADRIVLIEHGKVTREGTYGEILGGN
jgi:ABC-type multidrug transport system fused ATPase/permease subunit